MTRETIEDALATLTAGFYEETNRHAAPSQAIGRGQPKHPISIVGIGRAQRGPVVFVDDAAHRADALRWIARYVDAPCDVLAVPCPSTLPLDVKPNWWGWKTPAYGQLIGGKTFYRREHHKYGGASGGTLSIVARDKKGDLWACGNVHCFAAQHGTAAPPEHHVLWEAEWKAPFADVAGWQQITTSPEHRNFLDFGVARIRDDWEGDVRVGEILDVGRVTGFATMKVGDIGLMNGATTGRRDKRVIATDVVSRIRYRWTDPDTDQLVDGEFVLSGLTTFEGAREAPASQPGDSGSPVAVQREGVLKLGGFIFAGNGANGFAFAADAACSKFGLEV